MKYIFVSGGVLSGLGKGVTAASLGVTLKARGYRVTNIKCENYLNLDSGNINPVEHGDVFLCEDGTEADLDLGTYERFLGQQVCRKNYTTIGQIYQQVIQDTRELKYQGVTVDAIPFIPEEVIRRIEKAARGFDIILIELGGCAGEYQNIIYYEANRILKLKKPADVIHVHVTYFPKPSHISELKSKPTQLSVKNLNGMGIQPDFIVGRAEIPIDDIRKEKVAYYCNLSTDDIISNPDLPNIYELPLVFESQSFGSKALQKLGLPDHTPDLKAWTAMVERLTHQKTQTIKIAVLAKCHTSGNREQRDAYTSLIEAIEHAVNELGIGLELNFLKAELLEKDDPQTLAELQQIDGLIVPIGWGGKRGTEGKIKAIRYVREHQIPYLGLCSGMQLAIIEFARHVAKLTGTVIQEPTNNSHPGAHDATLKKGSRAHEIYQSDTISERHRHCFEVNPAYRQQLEEKGLVFSGTSPDGSFIEMLELPKGTHPFFLATQGHPEYKTRPLQPHPLFRAFIKAALAHQATA